VKVPSVPARDGRAPIPQDPSKNAPSNEGRGPLRYLGRLWRAEVPLRQVFWRDTIVVGSFLNVAAIGLAFLVAALGLPTGVGIAIYLSPIPYSVFLVAAVWRRSDIEKSEWTMLARVGAVVWFMLALIV
jgi:hypothetical protein